MSSPARHAVGRHVIVETAQRERLAHAVLLHVAVGARRVLVVPVRAY